MKRPTMLIAVAPVILIAACSSGRSASTATSTAARSAYPAASSTTATASQPSAVRASSAAPSSPAAAAVGLSGTWHGTYSGAFSGTFVLQWRQSAAKLTGTITLSTEPGALPLNGTVSGDQIQFGTVGSQAITYSGSVSGASMHGQYEITGGVAGSGAWSAARG